MPDDLILRINDIPGWELYELYPTHGIPFQYGYAGSAPSPLSEAFVYFYNNTTSYAMAITLKSFGSYGAATDFFATLYDHSVPHLSLNQSIRDVDSAIIISYSMGVQNPNNYTQFLTGFYWDYNFRIANVVVILQFGEIAPNESAVHPPIQEWMDQIVSIQVHEIQRFNIHL